MIFFRTILQRRILKHYWSDNEPFTIDSLCEQGIVWCRVWGRISLRMMLIKHQVIQGIDERDGSKKLIGTTDSKEEWDGLAEEKRLKYWSTAIVEDLGLAGLNYYEREETLAEMSKLIEEAKRNIAMREKERH